MEKRLTAGEVDLRGAEQGGHGLQCLAQRLAGQGLLFPARAAVVEAVLARTVAALTEDDPQVLR